MKCTYNEIKRRDALAALEHEFPGTSCGNIECEKICSEVCGIAKKMNMEPKPLVVNAIRERVAPETQCIPANTDSVSPLVTSPCRFGFVKPMEQITLAESKYDVFYIFRATGNSCVKCRTCNGIGVSQEQMKNENFMKKIGFWKQKDGIFRPHPNCHCKWVKIVKQVSINEKIKKTSHDHYHSEFKRGKGHDLRFRVKGSPGMIGNVEVGGVEIDSIDDMLNKLESKYNAHSVDKIIISNHGGLAGSFPMGNSDTLNLMSSQQKERLKKMLHQDSVIDIRMCYTSKGKEGGEAAQKLANELGCKVLGYEGPVSYYGSRPSYIKTDKDRPMPYLKHILPDHQPKMFYPQNKNN